MSNAARPTSNEKTMRAKVLSVQPLALDRGFTLLEMIISIGIFSVLVIAAIGITLGVSNAQIKAAGIQALQDNIRFSVELMTKEMRTGHDFVLTNLCAPGPGIIFQHEDPLGGVNFRSYYLADRDGNGTPDTLMRATEELTNSGQCFSTSNTNNIFSPLTADNIVVDYLQFSMRGEALGPSDGQPAITINIKIHSADPKYVGDTAMDLQTTVVQRLRDLANP